MNWQFMCLTCLTIWIIIFGLRMSTSLSGSLRKCLTTQIRGDLYYCAWSCSGPVWRKSCSTQGRFAGSLLLTVTQSRRQDVFLSLDFTSPRGNHCLNDYFKSHQARVWSFGQVMNGSHSWTHNDKVDCEYQFLNGAQRMIAAHVRLRSLKDSQ